MSHIAVLAFKGNITKNRAKVTWLVNTVMQHIDITSLAETTLNNTMSEKKKSSKNANKLHYHRQLKIHYNLSNRISF